MSQITEQQISDVKKFWTDFKINWQFISLYVSDGHDNLALDRMFQFAPDCIKQLIISFTYRKINNIDFDCNVIEMYVSPVLREYNIPLIKCMYDLQPQINNFQTVLYSPIVPIPKEVKVDDCTIKYSQLGCQTFPATKYGQPALNVLIMIDSSYLIEKLVQCDGSLVNIVENEIDDNIKRKIESGEIIKKYFPKTTELLRTIMFMLSQVITEHNIVNRIQYLEFTEEKKDEPYFELGHIANEIILIEKNSNYKKCHLCNRGELQMKLKRCSRCKAVYYCNGICQRVDFPQHSNFCK